MARALKERGMSSFNDLVEPKYLLGSKFAFVGFCLLPIFGYIAFVLMAPANVFDLYPATKPWADAVHRFFLSISTYIDIYKHARSTSYPQMAMLASALGVTLAWYLALFYFLNTTLDFENWRNLQRKVNNESVNQILKNITLLPIGGVVLVWIFYCLKGDPSFASGFTTHNRFGYAFMSTISIAVFGAGFGFLIPSIRLLFSKQS
jgi:hypothetical protein